jgi:hypothetical protein
MDYAIIERINAGLDKHFKSNKGNWVADWSYPELEIEDKVTIRLRDLWGRTKVAPKFVALYILRSEPQIEMVLWGTWIFTRASLRWAGHKC